MSVFTTDSAPSTRLEDSARGEIIFGCPPKTPLTAVGSSFGTCIVLILVVYDRSVNRSLHYKAVKAWLLQLLTLSPPTNRLNLR